MKSLCVFCSSSDRLDAKYLAAAEALGREMVARGWGLVYGGGRTGLMGALARSVKQQGGRVVGVMPDFMRARELAYEAADELIRVGTLRERKHVMETRADGFVALPGGFGTLEEIMEILTLRQVDVVRKPCVFFNQDGFYDDLLRLFARMQTDHFFKPENLALFRVAVTVPEVFTQLEAARTFEPSTPWFQTK